MSEQANYHDIGFRHGQQIPPDFPFQKLSTFAEGDNQLSLVGVERCQTELENAASQPIPLAAAGTPITDPDGLLGGLE